MNDENKNMKDWEPVTPPFSKNTIIEKIILSYPVDTIQEKFDKIGIHCFNCPVGPEDNLKTVAFLHEMENEVLIRRLNESFQGEKPLEEPSYYD